MNDEYIKEITIAMIERGWIITSDTNEGTAKEVAKFINTLRNELDK